MSPNGTPERVAGIDTRYLSPDTRRNAYTFVALGATSAAAFIAEHHDAVAQSLPQPLAAVATSMAHPALGYGGAWAAEAAARRIMPRSFGRIRNAAAFAGATLANFATETIQSATIAAPEYVNYVSATNLPETAKDYAAALAGMALYMWQNRRGSASHSRT